MQGGCLEGISGSPPGPGMDGAPQVVHRPPSTRCLRHAVAPGRPSYHIVELVLLAAVCPVSYTSQIGYEHRVTY